MTAACTISGTNGATTRTVDFIQSLSATATAIIHSINLRHSNPLIAIDTPSQSGNEMGENSVVINIGFVKNAFDLTFELRDGVGNFSTLGTTNYEKLIFLATIVTDPKTLTLNGTSFPCQIENLNLPYDAGSGNLILRGSMSVTLCKDIKMS
jgi:hypothetical protein